MDRYFMPKHVHFCRRGDAFVFLDLRKDEYTLIDGPGAAALQLLSESDSNLPNHSALNELLQDGLLTRENKDSGGSITATTIDIALEQLVDHESPVARINPAHLMRFILACTVAAANLRWRHIEDVVNSVQRRKLREMRPQRPMTEARDLTSVFHRLRSFFPRDYLCLYDSLALIEFLAAYRIFPTWVFGVRLEPWAAHCWVQEGKFTFNEGIEEAAGYTPIMAI